MARKRELIEPRAGDKRYIRRDAKGRFTSDQVDVGRSLVQDRRRQSSRVAAAGQGDTGDRRPRAKKAEPLLQVPNPLGLLGR
jgi:hypothetical protein